MPRADRGAVTAPCAAADVTRCRSALKKQPAMPGTVCWVLLLSLVPLDCHGVGTGAALKPPLGWQNWNGFGMRFNASLFRSMAGAMKANGMLAAGYNLISAGGSTYPHQGLPPRWNSTNDSNIINVIVRNSSGYYEIDPARFPGPGSSPECLDAATLRACLANHSKNGRSWSSGDPATCGCKNGNAGMAALSSDLRTMGFRWGSYSNEAGCKVAACNRTELNASKFRGFVDEDFDLMVNYFHSDYVMVDSVGNEPPYPKTDQRWWHWPHTVLNYWAEKVKAFTARPIILHSCHNGCGTPFSGPTLQTVPCNGTDSSQFWSVPTNDTKGSTSAPFPSGYLRNAGQGLCVGCGAYAPAGGPCANDALKFRNGSGYGAGMAACGQACPECTANQQWNYSKGPNSKMLLRADGSCLEVLYQEAKQVVVQQPMHCNGSSAQQWALGSATEFEGETFHQLVSLAAVSTDETVAAEQPQQQYCLSSTADHVTYKLDPWCAANFNMWRTSTDTLQVWSRTVVQIDSLVGLGHVSGPGHWGFGDCLELGVGGMCQGLLTWEESKTHLAIFAVASQPLFLGNDVRPGVMQQRLLDILLNPDMLQVNQEYDTEHAFAGDRIWTAAIGKELWAKPLPGKKVAAVLWNRNGTVVSTKTQGICGASEAPCTDNYTASVGAQTLILDFEVVPVEWLLTSDEGAAGETGPISCEVRDIFSGETGKEGADLGRFTGTWDAGVVPPHGSRFVLLSNCSNA
jgi:hypothetical protein